MGVQGLLKLIKDMAKDTYIKFFSGSRIGIDAMRWLLLDTMSQRPFAYTLKMIALLQYYKIVPVFVLDGRRQANKAAVRRQRYENRQKVQQAAIEMYETNKEKALQMERANVTVTPEIMLQYVDLLNQMHVEVMIAPGEADA